MNGEKKEEKFNLKIPEKSVLKIFSTPYANGDKIADFLKGKDFAIHVGSTVGCKTKTWNGHLIIFISGLGDHALELGEE